MNKKLLYDQTAGKAFARYFMS